MFYIKKLEEGNYKINIQIQSNKYELNQSDFWYFKFFLDNINSFYNQIENKEKKILIKIPGTKKFRLIDRLIFKKLYKDIKIKINFYKEAYIYDS